MSNPESGSQEQIANEQAFLDTLDDRQKSLYRNVMERYQSAKDMGTSYTMTPEEADVFQLQNEFNAKLKETQK